MILMIITKRIESYESYSILLSGKFLQDVVRKQ